MRHNRTDNNICVCGPVFAARLAGTDENVSTTTTTADTTKKIIEASPSKTAASD